MEVTRIVALAVVICVTAEAADYCLICRDHTMCKYPKFGPNCANKKATGMTAADKKVIVDVHNKLRTTVANGKEKQGIGGAQPPASNMRAMAWDKELASIAQRWANQCDFNHDRCRNVQRFAVGQNIYMSQSSGGIANYSADWEKAITSWYSEVSKFNNKGIGKFSMSGATGHYTQVIWAETNKLGCGYTAINKGNTISRYYICNYGPSGNYIGESIYKKGKACSKCPSGTLCNNKGLCK